MTLKHQHSVPDGPMTLKASSLSNRGYERNEHPRTPTIHNNMHPEGVPHHQHHHHNNMAYTKLIYHIVLRTYQDTAPIIEAHERDLYMYIFGFCKNHQCLLYRINGMPDHIHMLIGLHPTIAVASFVHDLKIATNNFMSANHDRFPEFKNWEQGYCALTYSEADKERVIQYIINQKEHHRKLAFRDELIALLKECGVEYDERYI